ncbi:unnamed protein product [Fraxinus pennsylvanica]|uniref:Uncharacterized protein n=1 Tax=Fraxinus pennsylvanica TaxID=56036 RepID=A0AAD2AD99_9LAMI|nr:unnamed protein product [Fraxinus pennsylvanica]
MMLKLNGRGNSSCGSTVIPNLIWWWVALLTNVNGKVVVETRRDNDVKKRTILILEPGVQTFQVPYRVCASNSWPGLETPKTPTAAGPNHLPKNGGEKATILKRVHSLPQLSLFKDHGDDINKHSHFPPIMVYGAPKKAEEFSTKESLKGAPWNSAGYKNHSLFSRDDDRSTDDLDDDNYDRHEGYGGPYSPKPVHTKPAYDTDYGMRSPEGADGKPSFVPPAGMHQQYTAPVSTSPKKDTYPETARNRPIGRSPPRNKPETDTRSQKTSWKPLFEPAAASHPQYTAPVSTSPKKDAYHETSRNRPLVPNPRQGKPESDTGYASDSPKAGRNPSFGSLSGRRPQPTTPVKDSYYETANNSKPAHDNDKVSAHAMTRPGKEGNQQTIDSNEARKRYGGKAVNQPKPEEEYRGTIDCKEAARKYNGVFVP